MALLPPAPKQEYKVLEPENYEAVITNIEPVENPYYKPGEDRPAKAQQLQWTFKTRQAPNDGVKLTAWTGIELLRDSRCKLTQWISKLDPDFDLDAPYDTDKLKGMPVRVSVENESKEKNGETKVYNKVEKILASKLKTPSEDEFRALCSDLGGEVVEPF